MGIGVVVAGIAALWYGVFGLQPYNLSAEELATRYGPQSNSLVAAINSRQAKPLSKRTKSQLWL